VVRKFFIALVASLALVAGIGVSRPANAYPYAYRGYRGYYGRPYAYGRPYSYRRPYYGAPYRYHYYRPYGYPAYPYAYPYGWYAHPYGYAYPPPLGFGFTFRF
jgi:hypothetical protein